MNPVIPNLFRGKWTLAEYDEKIAALRGLSADLGLPTLPDLHIGVKVEDKNGKVLTDFYEQGHSWNRNAWNLFTQAMLFANSNMAASNTGETSFRKGSLIVRSSNGGFNANTNVSGINSSRIGSITDASSGIIVGNSAEPFHGEDFCLWSQCIDGTATNRLSHQGQVAPSATYDPVTSTYSVTLSRVFNNNSPATIILNEVGWSTASYLFSRDVLSSPVTIPVGGQLTVTISCTSTSFSAIDALCGTPQTIGSTFGGGTYLGYVANWQISPSIINGHTKFALILSPKSGGEISARSMRPTAIVTPAPTPIDQYYGGLNTSTITAITDSALGIAVLAANAANLGGYNDWYIPTASGEMLHVNASLGSISAGEMPTNALHWVTQSSSNNLGFVYNPITNASATSPTNGSYITRLIRRHKLV